MLAHAEDGSGCACVGGSSSVMQHGWMQCCRLSDAPEMLLLVVLHSHPDVKHRLECVATQACLTPLHVSPHKHA